MTKAESYEENLQHKYEHSDWLKILSSQLCTMPKN